MQRLTTLAATTLILVMIVAVAIDASISRAQHRHSQGYFTWLAISRYFPAAKRSYAYRIARCETGGTFSRFSTGSAGERGEFQIHPVHAGQRLAAVGRVPAMTVNFGRLYEVAYNVRVAFLLSRGGTNWAPWTCSRYV